MDQLTERASHVLRTRFGHADFRDGQADVVRAVTSGRDVLAVLPTGAGKSICYQIPALLAPGPSLIISPLIALIQDQVSALQARGIRAASVTSASSNSDRRRAEEYLTGRGPSLVYAAPERLASSSFLGLARRSRLSLVVVDEAHCVSEWGHDFRPDYLGIGKFASLVGRPPVAAFTATATPATRLEIVQRLGLYRPAQILRSVDRPGLFWEVVQSQQETCAFEHVSRAVRYRGDGAALVYVQTRALTTAVAAALRRTGQQAEAYHAGLSAVRRAGVQARFLSAPRGVVVATCAFGMGIDHPSVRLVAHLGVPGALETYVQEAGRAGRDGRPARCLLVTGSRDLVLHRKRIRELQRSSRHAARSRLAAMLAYVREPYCRRAAISRWFGEPVPSCGGCDRCDAGGCRQ